MLTDIADLLTAAAALLGSYAALVTARHTRTERRRDNRKRGRRDT